ncbi:MAG: molybdopterin-guanine dinucleotide biosynthesis protein B [Desulfobacteraceae bacterium]|nr:molybdopterin-guanine dinucleotide biosynthesis protein B [Desulfobacteraceae bacterium]MBC2755267.1 molybdopterin-guanine dinucleotide biosynthesis protein B [Desulfobacteraceae bacterium]
MTPIISIVGYSDAGKTTLVEKLVPELKKKGYRVGTIKHSEHESNFDTKGKDSWRHFASGADAVVVASVDKIVMIRKRENRTDDSHAQLSSIENHLTDMDVIIAEGYKNAGFPKIEVFRSQVNDVPVCLNDDTLVAIVTDADLNINVPVFGLEELQRLADFIEQNFLSFQNVSKSGDSILIT